jgi:hypothetical protein
MSFLEALTRASYSFGSLAPSDVAVALRGVSTGARDLVARLPLGETPPVRRLTDLPRWSAQFRGATSLSLRFGLGAATEEAAAITSEAVSEALGAVLGAHGGPLTELSIVCDDGGELRLVLDERALSSAHGGLRALRKLELEWMDLPDAVSRLPLRELSLKDVALSAAVLPRSLELLWLDDCDDVDALTFHPDAELRELSCCRYERPRTALLRVDPQRLRRLASLTVKGNVQLAGAAPPSLRRLDVETIDPASCPTAVFVSTCRLASLLLNVDDAGRGTVSRMQGWAETLREDTARWAALTELTFAPAAMRPSAHAHADAERLVALTVPPSVRVLFVRRCLLAAVPTGVEELSLEGVQLPSLVSAAPSLRALTLRGCWLARGETAYGEDGVEQAWTDAVGGSLEHARDLVLDALRNAALRPCVERAFARSLEVDDRLRSARKRVLRAVRDASPLLLPLLVRLHVADTADRGDNDDPREHCLRMELPALEHLTLHDDRPIFTASSLVGAARLCELDVGGFVPTEYVFGVKAALRRFHIHGHSNVAIATTLWEAVVVYHWSRNHREKVEAEELVVTTPLSVWSLLQLPWSGIQRAAVKRVRLCAIGSGGALDRRFNDADARACVLEIFPNATDVVVVR